MLPELVLQTTEEPKTQFLLPAGSCFTQQRMSLAGFTVSASCCQRCSMGLYCSQTFPYQNCTWGCVCSTWRWFTVWLLQGTYSI